MRVCRDLLAGFVGIGSEKSVNVAVRDRHPLSTAQRTQQTAAKKEAHILLVVSSYFTQLKNAEDQGHKPASPYSFAIDSDIPYSTLVRHIRCEQDHTLQCVRTCRRGSWELGRRSLSMLRYVTVTHDLEPRDKVMQFTP